QVGEGDQALRVDRVLGHDHGRKREAPHVVPLLGGPGEDDSLHALLAAEEGENLREERVRLAVVERDVRRRPHDDEDPVAVEPERPRARAVNVRWWEPWASAASKPRPRAQLRRADNRVTIVPSLPSRDRPPWRPTSSASIPCCSRSCTVCA